MPDFEVYAFFPVRPDWFKRGDLRCRTLTHRALSCLGKFPGFPGLTLRAGKRYLSRDRRDRHKTYAAQAGAGRCF